MSTSQTKPKRSWLLIASLALNVAVIGLVAGFMFKQSDRNKKSPPPTDIVRNLVRAIPENNRPALREGLAQKRPQMRKISRELRAQKLILSDLLVAEPFEISDVEAAFMDNKRIVSQITDGGFEILLDRIEQMNAADRATFSQNLKRLVEAQDERRKKKR